MNPICILMTVEGLGINLLGCYGGAISKTPHVDQFAAHSVVFDQCWLQTLEIENTLRALLFGDSYSIGIKTVGTRRDANESATKESRQLSLADAIKEMELQSCFVTDAVELAESEFLDFFDEVALVDFQEEDAANDQLEQTCMAKLIQFAVTKLYEAESPKLGIDLLWIHSKGLRGLWDAPYELRTIPCDEGDPEPTDSIHPPRKQLDAESDPDVLFDAICGASAQAAVFDFAWSYLNELLVELDGFSDSEKSSNVSVQPVVLLMGVSGYPLGEHESIGEIDNQLYAERLHVPLIIQPYHLQLGGRLPHLIQPWQVSHLLVQCFCDKAIQADSKDHFWQKPPASPVDWETNQLLAWAASDQEYALITPAWTARVLVADSTKANPNRVDLSIDAITPMASWQVFVNPDDRFQQNDITSRVEYVVKQMSEIATTLRDAIYGTEGTIGMQELQRVLETQLSPELIRFSD